MGLYDRDTERQNEEKRKKVKKIILVSIIVACLFIFILIGLIVYIAGKPSPVSIYLDSELNNELLELLKINTDESGNVELDEQGKPIIYAPIKEVAQYFGYDDRNGNYMTVSEDTDSCNVKNEQEVAIFTLDSNIIYKKDLTNEKSNYETYNISEKVFKENEELYTNREGLEKAYNIDISYNSKANSINIFTLDYFISYYTEENATTNTTKLQDWGYSGLDETFVNQKAILDNMLVVKDDTGTYGVVSLNNEKIFSIQYDLLTYMPENKAFLIKSNDKYGIISASGETKIKPYYDSLELIDNDKQLYLVSDNNKYGVIDIDSNIVVPLEYGNIGIDITKFEENNLTNRYIIQETLIPVQQNGKWGFYTLNGDLIGDGIVYDSIGCISTNSQAATVYPVLSIPEYNSIVVGKKQDDTNGNSNEKYGCINLEGEITLPIKTESIYKQISGGETNYFMIYKGKTTNIKDLIKSKI